PGQHLTQDDCVDVFRRKLGSFESRLDRQRTEFMGEQRTKCTIEGSYRRPRSGHNYYVSHDQLPVQSHVLAASSHLRRPPSKPSGFCHRSLEISRVNVAIERNTQLVPIKFTLPPGHDHAGNAVAAEICKGAT